jgi:tRNA U34 5-carboxymethylaminomethyl modifying GTPase MnmE/TrmE
VALSIRSALHALNDIIGITTTEDILGLIFSKFCIGK